MKYALLSTLIFMAMLGNWNSAQALPVFQGSYVELRGEALQNEKAFFITFQTDWCRECSNMQKYTFTNPELSGYVRANYLAFEVDAERLDGDGVALAQQFSVMFFPTIIIFSPDGQEVERLGGYQQAPNLLAALKRNVHFGPTIDLSPSSTAKSSPGTGPSPGSIATQPASVPASTPAIPSGQGLFRLSVSPQASVGYGVQTGVFGDYANVLKEVQRLEAKGYNVLVNINQLSGKTVFKLILGPYLTRTEATNARDKFRKEGNGEGMVVDLIRYK